MIQAHQIVTNIEARERDVRLSACTAKREPGRIIIELEDMKCDEQWCVAINLDAMEVRRLGDFLILLADAAERLR